MLLQHAFLFLLWAIFYTLHSFLAHNASKKYFRELLQQHFRFYRLGYNITSIVLLSILIFYQFTINTVFLFSENLFSKIIGTVLLITGAVIVYIAFKSFNLYDFFGFEQLYITKKSTPQSKPVLIKTGLYKHVRHPLYFGILIAIMGILVLVPYYSTLVFVFTTLLYLPLGIKLEEEKLIEEFGKSYIEYQKEVKKLIPYLW